MADPNLDPALFTFDNLEAVQQYIISHPVPNEAAMTDTDIIQELQAENNALRSALTEMQTTIDLLLDNHQQSPRSPPFAAPVTIPQGSTARTPTWFQLSTGVSISSAASAQGSGNGNRTTVNRKKQALNYDPFWHQNLGANAPSLTFKNSTILDFGIIFSCQVVKSTDRMHVQGWHPAGQFPQTGGVLIMQVKPSATNFPDFSFTASTDNYMTTYNVDKCNTKKKLKAGINAAGFDVNGNDLMLATLVYRGYACMGTLDSVKRVYTRWAFDQDNASGMAKGELPYQNSNGG